MKSTLASLLLLAQQTYGGGGGFDYDHMTSWADDFPMCGVEKQSPIDIRHYKAEIDHAVCDATFDWHVDFTHQTFKISNNGLGLVLQPVTQTNIDPDHELESTFVDAEDTEWMTLSESDNSIGRLPNYFKPDGSHTEEFCLHSFHFHWAQTDDVGSEHTVDGYSYPLEVHFVHYSCAHASLGSTLEHLHDKKSVEEAREAGEDTYQLGVVGIFFEIRDEPNPFFSAIFNNETWDKIQQPSDESVIVEDVNLVKIIPSSIFSSGYYSYEGSLTTPPCTDIVRWHVMNARSYLSAEQMEMFRQLSTSEGKPVGPNYREVQSNPATLYSCVGESSEDEHHDEEEEEGSSMSWWAVAVISSLATAVVMGAIFLCMYKQQERAMEMQVTAQKADLGQRATSDSYGHHGTR